MSDEPEIIDLSVETIELENCFLLAGFLHGLGGSDRPLDQRDRTWLKRAGIQLLLLATERRAADK